MGQFCNTILKNWTDLLLTWIKSLESKTIFRLLQFKVCLSDQKTVDCCDNIFDWLQAHSFSEMSLQNWGQLQTWFVVSRFWKWRWVGSSLLCSWFVAPKYPLGTSSFIGSQFSSAGHIRLRTVKNLIGKLSMCLVSDDLRSLCGLVVHVHHLKHCLLAAPPPPPHCLLMKQGEQYDLVAKIPNFGHLCPKKKKKQQKTHLFAGRLTFLLSQNWFSCAA